MDVGNCKMSCLRPFYDGKYAYQMSFGRIEMDLSSYLYKKWGGRSWIQAQKMQPPLSSASLNPVSIKCNGSNI